MIHNIEECNNSTQQLIESAGLNFDVASTPVQYNVGVNTHSFNNRRVLYRTDNHKAFGVVSDDYKIHQPKDIINFYQNLANVDGFRLVQASSIGNGRKIWALAETDTQLRIHGNDVLKGYLFLATSYDSSMATVARFITNRLFCNNQLQVILHGDMDALKVVAGGVYRITHASEFKPVSIKEKLGLDASNWDKYAEYLERLSETKVSKADAIGYFIDMFYPNGIEDTKNKLVEKKMKLITNIYDNAPGQNVVGAKGTAWGLVNAVTYFVDNYREGRTNDTTSEYRLFGQGEVLKNKAFTQALKLAA